MIQSINNKIVKNIIYRQVKNQDAKQFITLINTVWRDTYNHIFPEEVFLDMENRAESKIQNFSKHFYNDDKTFVYVAEYNRKIVGVACGRLDAEYEHYNQMNYANLQIFYVLPEYQKKGIGTTLKNLFVDWLKKHNATKYVIGVLKNNAKGRAVYENWGGKLDDYTKPFVKLGVGYEEVFYTFEI